MAVTKSEATGAGAFTRGQMLIDGTWTAGAGRGEINVESPGNRSIIGSIPRGGAEDVDQAVKAATRPSRSGAASSRASGGAFCRRSRM